MNVELSIIIIDFSETMYPSNEVKNEKNDLRCNH